jgi:hypothetical protein
MSADNYILGVIKKYYLNPISLTDSRIKQMTDFLENWAGVYLNKLKLSGSTAKDTLIKGNTDIDIFISLKSSNPDTLKTLYNKLYDSLNKELELRKQNVSIGVVWNNLKFDLIPAKQHKTNSNYHSLYVRKGDTWTQANIDLHINKVSNSERLNEIRATKIWRENHNLEFPSFYLELVVIEAIKNRNKNQLSINFWTVLEYLRDSFNTLRVIDPSNSNNIISESLSTAEKNKIAQQAANSINQQYWKDIIS